MKNVILVLAIGLFSVAGSAMERFQDGSFAGQGRWKDSAGRSGVYAVQTQIKDGTVTSSYRYDLPPAQAGGPVRLDQGKTFTLQAGLVQNGQFPVLIDGKVAGTGYCLSVQCHYSIQIEGVSLEETLTFKGGQLFKIGSKNVSGTTVIWEEALK